MNFNDFANDNENNDFNDDEDEDEENSNDGTKKKDKSVTAIKFWKILKTNKKKMRKLM